MTTPLKQKQFNGKLYTRWHRGYIRRYMTDWAKFYPTIGYECIFEKNLPWYNVYIRRVGAPPDETGSMPERKSLWNLKRDTPIIFLGQQ